MTTDDENDTGGDPACWLHRVCPECGALVEGDSGDCWRCGTHRPPEAAR